MTVSNNLIIRNLDLGRGITLAPMAGITDSPVRRLAKRFGADLVFTEMVPAKGLFMVKRKPALLRMMRYVDHKPDEKPVCVQLFGHEPETFTKASGMVLDAGADCIDVNAGCPVKKVVSSGSGAKLMRDPELLARIVEAVRRAGDFPLTVKIRLGWDEGERNFIEVAKRVIDAGADAITLHGRTRAQMFNGKADWSAIADLVNAIDVPVIGNGDITCGNDAVEMVRQTGCAGVMIGRGANGRPWIFNQVRAALEGQPIPNAPKPMEVFGIFQSHLGMLEEEKGAEKALRLIRKHLLWYSKGYTGAVALRRTLFTFTEAKKVLKAARDFFERAQEELSNNSGT